MGHRWIVISFLLIGSSGADANTWTRAGVQQGATSTEEECAGYGDTAAWVVVSGRGDCIRYFHAGLASDRNPLAHIWFHGDAAHRSTRKVNRGYRNESAERQQRAARGQYGAHSIPYIQVSRPGVYGSSGDHSKRLEPRNPKLVIGAVEKIVRRHGIEALALSGRSGGGLLVAALLNVRSDIRCAVITSGHVAVQSRRWHKGWRPLDYAYDPIDGVVDMPVDPDRRIFMLGDPRDERVPWHSQVEYYRKVKRLGHRIWLFDTIAGGPFHHSLAWEGRWVMSQCIKRESAETIRQWLPPAE